MPSKQPYHQSGLTQSIQLQIKFLVLLAELLRRSNPRAQVNTTNQQHPGVMQQPGP